MKINLEPKVLKVPSEVPATRNSDISLMIEIWRRYYPESIITGKTSGVEVVPLKALYDLPREDNIKRLRAHIQNDLGKFLPTSLEVVKQRKINEAEWAIYVQQFHPDIHKQV